MQEVEHRLQEIVPTPSNNAAEHASGTVKHTFAQQPC